MFLKKLKLDDKYLLQGIGVDKYTKTKTNVDWKS